MIFNLIISFFNFKISVIRCETNVLIELKKFKIFIAIFVILNLTFLILFMIIGIIVIKLRRKKNKQQRIYNVNDSLYDQE